MNIKGTIINYYLHCKRECFIYLKGIRCYQEQTLLKIGRYYHKEFENEKNSNNFINGVKVDKIKGDYVIEFKKTNSSLEAAEWQLLFYLWKLKEVGIIKKGKLVFKENRNNKEVILTKEKEQKLISIISEIKKLINSNKIPPVLNQRKCRKCAYFEFCYC